MRYLVLLATIAASLLAIPAAAQEMPPMPEIENSEVVATGLNGPQGVYVDSEGTLWIIDSGVGGDEEIEATDPTTFELIPATFGETGRIIRMVDGEPEVVATLPSVAVGQDFISGAGVLEIDGEVYATTGAWHISGGEEPALPLQGHVVRVVDGAAESVSDLWAHELANNPDGTSNIETHPYHMGLGPDGLIYVADAAANALITVDPQSGETATVAGFEGQPGIFPNPWRDNELIADPVPTGVVVREDGTALVSYLSGAPFIPGSAKIVSVSPEGEVSDFAPGLTMLTDLTAAPDGTLYGLSFGMFTEQGPVPNSGSILRVADDGTAEVVVEGLPFATGMAIDGDGNGYVSLFGIAIPEAGMVLRIDGLTEREGMPMPMMDAGAPGEGEGDDEMEDMATEEASS